MTQKQKKVNELMRQEVSISVMRDIKNPHLGFVTVTRCEVSADISYCKVFVTVLGDDKAREDNLLLLKNAADFIRVCISKRVRMRQVPALDFRIDTSIDETQHLLEVMEKDRIAHSYGEGGDEEHDD
ncbi:MAG: 30S ribosome-binding factor RbfA [Abditibacteriota bacterium]|nr:30S ribosome-binding factor RbfA [Abditibacteriota bacterium]